MPITWYFLDNPSTERFQRWKIFTIYEFSKSYARYKVTGCRIPGFGSKSQFWHTSLSFFIRFSSSSHEKLYEKLRTREQKKESTWPKSSPRMTPQIESEFYLKTKDFMEILLSEISQFCARRKCILLFNKVAQLPVENSIIFDEVVCTSFDSNFMKVVNCLCWNFKILLWVDFMFFWRFFLLVFWGI